MSQQPSPADTTVLVTGATGFIGEHCVLELLGQGYRVRGTMRSLAREPALRATIAGHGGDTERLDLVATDLTSDDGWPEAVAGCRYVLHVASPLPRQPPKHENDLIEPARDGALRVLKAASEAGVERVVMTSSMAAVWYGHDRDGSKVFDESDWSDLDGKKMGAYEKSKTIAEKTAWTIAEHLPEGKKIELVTINPGLVLGPVLEEDYGTSAEAVRKLMKREFPGLPNLGWPVVDVRDVATAHVKAMTVPEAAGKRFCCVVEFATMTDIAKVLDQHYGDRYKIPMRPLPSFVLRLAAIFDKTARLALHDLDQRAEVDNSRIKEVLDWKPRGLEEMVTATADSLIEYKVV